MDKPEKPGEDASPAEIYEYMMRYDEWAQVQGAKRFPDRTGDEAEEDEAV